MEGGERRQKKKFHIDPQLRRGIRLDEVVVLPHEGTVICHGQHRHLPPKAMEILLFLCQNHHRLISVEKLLVFGWGDANAKRANLTHVISEIRQALDDHKECPEFIQTLPRKGYRLIAKMAPMDEKVLYPNVWPLTSSPQHDGLHKIKSDNHWHLSLALFKNSKLFSVSIAFILSTWVLIQVFEVLFPIFDVPQWGLKLAVLVLVVGFPLALLFTWLKEIKLKKVLLSKSQKDTKKKFFFKQLALDFSFIGLMSIGVGYLAFHLIESIETDKQLETTDVEQYAIDVPMQDNLVAVTPFTFNVGEVLPDYFKATLQSELINALSSQADFRLVSQRAVNELPANAKLSEYADKLGARYLLDGQVTGNGKSFAIFINLTDTQSALQVWSSRLQGTPNEILGVQKGLYRQVFNALALMAEHPPSSDLSLISTNDFKAYDSYIQGRNELANASNEQGLENAERYFLKSLEYDPKFSMATAGLCQTYLDQYDINNSLATFRVAKEQCGMLLGNSLLKAGGYVALGNLNRISGEYNEAVKLYSKAIELSPQNLDAITGLARSYQAISEYVLAEELFKKAIKFEPGYWRNYSSLGDFLFDNGQYKAAAEQYARVTLLRPNDAQAFNRLGAAFYLDYQMEPASVAWERSLDIEPSATTYSNLATALFSNHQFKRASEIYKKSLKLRPNDPVYWANLGDAQKFSQQLNEAKESYAQAVKLAEEQLLVNPNDFVLLGMRARYHSELGKCDEALNTSTQLSAKDISDPYLFYDLSIASINCKKIEGAKVLINRAIGLGYSQQLLAEDIQFVSIIDQLAK